MNKDLRSSTARANQALCSALVDYGTVTSLVESHDRLKLVRADMLKRFIIDQLSQQGGAPDTLQRCIDQAGWAWRSKVTQREANNSLVLASAPLGSYYSPRRSDS